MQNNFQGMYFAYINLREGLSINSKRKQIVSFVFSLEFQDLF